MPRYREQWGTAEEIFGAWHQLLSVVLLVPAMLVLDWEGRLAPY